jgi:light-regulated signal transduction histidine kinase (bacteriophytochrome)
VVGSDSPAQACLPVASPLSASQDPLPPSIFAIHPNDRHPSPGGRFVTNRFDYVPGGVVSSTVPSITGRKIYRCEDEPIHIPGAIQRLGALIAVREEHGFFVVRVVSENSHSIIGLEPEALFQLDCLTDILPSLDKHDFTIRARILRADIHPTSPDVFSISLTPNQAGTETRVFCAMHMNKEADLIVCELEIDQNLTESSRLSDAGFPKEPVQKVDNEASEAERLLSTTPTNKPLYILKVAKASSRPLNPMDLFRTLAEIQEQASSSTTLSNLTDTIVGLVHDLTGFHRVMVYQFDNTGAGM